jgi:hypothetical protein
MGSPATIYGQDYPGEVAGLLIGEQQGGTSKLVRRGPPAERDLVANEVQDLRIVVDAGVKRSAKRAWGQGVDSDSGSGQFDGKTAGELDDSSLARRVAAPGRGSEPRSPPRHDRRGAPLLAEIKRSAVRRHVSTRSDR